MPRPPRPQACPDTDGPLAPLDTSLRGWIDCAVYHFPDLPERAVSEIPKDLLYTEDHEYIKPGGEPGVVYIGVTDFAQGELGDIVFVELPKVGAKYKKHDVFGTIEAVKAVSELYSPVGGEVLEVNKRLDAEPALVNSSPYGDGWMIKMRLADETEKSALLDAAAYEKKIG
jgi:glycine cleavage system H protein